MRRREFLARAGALLPLAPGVAMMRAGDAHAQAGGYRALVCVFLYGGNDGINTIPPVEAAAYARYSAVRGAVAIPRANIVALNATHGLHPNLASLRPIWDEGRLALIFNAGPLARPMTRDQYLQWRGTNDAARVPESLFSHSDQQNLWQNADSRTLTSTGWGGRLADRIAASPVMSFAGTTRYGAGTQTQELVLPGPGSALGLNGYWNGRQPNARRAALDALVASASVSTLQASLAAQDRGAFDTANRLGAILAQQPASGGADPANPEISAAFANLAGDNASGLSRQLYQVAKMIKNRATVGGGRHLFVVSLGGFDTHAGQLGAHAALMTQLGAALASFHAATKALGVAGQVTTFTESDFGRTFKPNATAGTDHAWGNEHLVIGGAVRGGTSYGTYPSLVLGGPDDAGAAAWEQQGRWIPSISVDQYAATLAAWFAPELVPQFGSIFPNLANFTLTDLGFLNAA